MSGPEFSAVAIRRDFVDKIECIRVARGLRSHKATVEDLVERAYVRLDKARSDAVSESVDCDAPEA